MPNMHSCHESHASAAMLTQETGGPARRAMTSTA
jgi:hypothetical protein